MDGEDHLRVRQRRYEPHHHVLRREPAGRGDEGHRARHATGDRGRRGQPVLPASRGRPAGRRPGAGRQRAGRRGAAGGVHADHAVRAQRPQGGPEPHPAGTGRHHHRLAGAQAQGDAAGGGGRAAPAQAGDPAPVPEHRVLRLWGVRRLRGEPDLLRQAAGPADPRRGGAVGRPGPVARPVQPGDRGPERGSRAPRVRAQRDGQGEAHHHRPGPGRQRRATRVARRAAAQRLHRGTGHAQRLGLLLRLLPRLVGLAARVRPHVPGPGERTARGRVHHRHVARPGHPGDGAGAVPRRVRVR